jgi:hypothetical protein
MRLRAALAAIILLFPLAAFADDLTPPVDPFVALDAAKTTLADGKLEDARSELAQIPTDAAEPYVNEEVVFQRMLLEAAFLDASNFLWSELGRMKLGNGAYAKWLYGERDKYADSLAQEVRGYLQLTEGGYTLTFVRFRLPEVTDQHVADVELYSDHQVLTAAAQNWDDGRDGLGRGLILAQARVAVALSAASFYDMPNSGNLQQVTGRLAAGVPIYPAVTMDWIAETCHRLEGAGNGLGGLYKAADTRLAAMLAQHPSAQLAARLSARAAPLKAAAVDTSKQKPVKKSGKKRKGRRKK